MPLERKTKEIDLPSGRKAVIGEITNFHKRLFTQAVFEMTGLSEGAELVEAAAQLTREQRGELDYIWARGCAIDPELSEDLEFTDYLALQGACWEHFGPKAEEPEVLETDGPLESATAS